MNRIDPMDDTLRAASSLAETAGLMHDLGKLTRRFLAKLRMKQPQRDPIAHEWLSAWLVAHMLRHGEVSMDGLLVAWDEWEREGIHAFRQKADGWHPFHTLKDAYSACLMLITTHHRLFSRDPRGTRKERTPPDTGEPAPSANHVSHFSPSDSDDDWYRATGWPNDKERAWWESVLNRANESLTALRTSTDASSPAYWHKIALVARAAMILADHNVSARSFDDEPGAASYPKTPAYANSRRPKPGKPKLNQPLAWHLEQVGKTAASYVEAFAASDLPALSELSRQRIRSDSGESNPRFLWQSSSAQFVQKLRESTEGDCAFLIFNVASTGAGKTRANVRLLEAARDPKEPLRITAGFNLRALTLQTATAYRKELGFGNEECACMVGDPLARALHWYEQTDDMDDPGMQVSYQSTGCDSDEFLGQLPPWVERITHADPGTKTLLSAPVLVCTMDYLVAAGDPRQQAHHAHALLRIAHSDLIIDEADSYDPEGLVAVLRVVQMAGMFGRNVVVSSATLSPVLAERIHRAWHSGIAMHRASSQGAIHTHELIVSNLGSAAGRQARREEGHDFETWYRRTLEELYASERKPWRLGRVVPITENGIPLAAGGVDGECLFNALAETVAASCLAGHEHHCWPVSRNGQEVRVSIGVVRLANVAPLQKLAKKLLRFQWPEGTDARLCVYHARDVAMRRYYKEAALDGLLKRHGDPDLSKHPQFAEVLDALPGGVRDLIFIVLVSPIEEVGRDHDFDWAVIEPTSIHSIIQLAGRVNRHRLREVKYPNVFILERNVRHLAGNTKSCFTKPGLQQQSRDGGEATHLPGTASVLLGTANGRRGALSEEDVFVLDAGMVFALQARCLFAKEDEEAIRKLLEDVTPYLEPDCELWACDWFYTRYPLRESSNEERWKARPVPNRELSLHQYERAIGGSRWIPKVFVRETRPEDGNRLWLCPDLHEVDRYFGQLVEGFASKPERDDLMDHARQFTVRFGDPRISWYGIETGESGRGNEEHGID